MFYCKACGDEYGYPTFPHVPRSTGRCECCHEGAVCFDVPSYQLPDPDEKRALESIQEAIDKQQKN